MYSHILFDADNTLLDFDKAQLSSFKMVLNFYGLVYSEELFRQYQSINHVLWDQFERGEIDKDTVQEKRFFDFFCTIGRKIDGSEANCVFQRGLCKQSWLIPHAEETCRVLSSYVNLSIVTNGVGRTQNERIRNSKISNFISHIIVSETIGFAKPSIEFFEEAFKVIGCTFSSKTLIVGDSLSSDIQGGINAGIDTCWYNSKRLDLPMEINVDYVISDLAELKQIVLGK